MESTILSFFARDIVTKDLEYIKKEYIINSNNYDDFLKESFYFDKFEVFKYIYKYRCVYIQGINLSLDEWLFVIIRNINKESDDIKYLTFLLEKGANPNHTDHYGNKNFCIEKCIIWAKPNMLKELIKFKVNVNLLNHWGDNSLRLTLIHKFSGCVDILINNKININNRNVNGKTCLHYAVEDNNTDMVKKLILSKANIHLRSKVQKKTPLDMVLENKNKCIKNEIVDLIKSLHSQKRKRKFDETKKDLCIFCLDKLDKKEENNFMTKCYHVYHKNCWEDYPKKQECPICRQNA